MSSKILILGKAGHGKSEVERILAEHGWITYPTTELVIQEVWPILRRLHRIDFINPEYVLQNKDRYRREIKLAIDVYTMYEPDKLVKAVLSRCDVYTGLRSNRQYQASKRLFAHRIWVTNETDSEDVTMDINYNPTEMHLLRNEGTLADLEARVADLAHRLRLNEMYNFSRDWL